jgi:hypothetical protein
VTTISEWYKRVNAVFPSPLPRLTDRAAKTAVKRLWRWATGRKLTYKIVIVRGKRRRTWMDGGKLNVAPDGGWGHFCHDLSHLLWQEENGWMVRPHERGHAQFEHRMRKEVVRRGWLDGKLDASLNVDMDAPQPVDPIERLKAGIAKAVERREARARTALLKAEREVEIAEKVLALRKHRVAKLRRRVRYYDRRKTEKTS